MTMPRTYVRLAHEGDSGHLVTLNAEFNGPGTTEAEVAASLRNTRELVAVTMLDEVPVGFACAQYFRSFCYREAQGEITELYIREPARRNGLATMLISYLEQLLREQGVRSVKILTGQNNDIAQRTYERAGYAKKEYAAFQKML